MVLNRIVVASREARIQQLASQLCQELFHADSLEEALDITQTVEPELVIFDQQFDCTEIQAFIDTNGAKALKVPAVAVSIDSLTKSQCQSLLATGIYDLINGSSQFNRLGQIVGTLAESPRQDTGTDQSFFCDEAAAAVGMAGTSEAMKKTFNMIKMVAASQCNPVLIVGETGTGKELAARAVHHLRHPGRKFVAVNCAALTANLLESELFGHVKGSFTGAERDKTGLLELADDGTLLLDEVSEMPIELQAKLLRVLQERTFRKVGGTADIKCRATLIASSNRNLHEQIEEKQFRRDLYYRLSICPINLPPLRSPARSRDIALLAEFFLNRSLVCPDKARNITSLTKLAVKQLAAHSWPGNVRELRNVIERAIMLESTTKIGCSSIIFNCDNLEEHFPETPAQDTKDFSLSKAEKQLINRALQETGWQKTKAASLLGITRATLYAKVKQYNLRQKQTEQHAVGAGL